jgi:multidrug efflux pump subunit AcrA (membrane-fusion protein)
VDDDYTASTESAVRAWQKAIGADQTGQVAPGQVIYAPAGVRIAEQLLRVGDVAAGDVLAATGTATVVTATVDTTRIRRRIEVGMAVSVLLADSAEVPGAVRGISQPPPGTDGAPSESKVVLEVEPVDADALAEQDGAVTVRIVVDERKGVIAVPVIGLVALAEGGYGVQVVDGETTRYVAVETGLFARGYVEIVSGDLREGMRIVVPA